jgi:pimeloyl-ACP methyl ester carboxylesterase
MPAPVSTPIGATLATRRSPCRSTTTSEQTPRDRRRRLPVILTTGKYDYITTPELAEATAKQSKGAQFIEMKCIGHFPMSENYPVFRGTSADRPAPPRWASNDRGPAS